MNKDTLIQLINEKLSTHEIANKLNLSQTTICYWLRKYGLNTNFVSVGKFCEVCGAALKGKQYNYCSKKCKGASYTASLNNYLNQKERATQRKLSFIQMKGGCCQMCGYNGNSAALLFHHKDANDKVFSIDSRTCSNTNMKSLLIELDKCILLCHNCHMEIHHPELKLVLAAGLEPTKDFTPSPIMSRDH